MVELASSQRGWGAFPVSHFKLGVISYQKMLFTADRYVKLKEDFQILDFVINQNGRKNVGLMKNLLQFYERNSKIRNQVQPDLLLLLEAYL